MAGVDVGKYALDLQVGTIHSANYKQPQGVPQLVADCVRLGVSLVVIESTGGYERNLVRALHEVGVYVSRVPPNRVRSFARAEGTQGKNDRLDAALLVRFGECMVPLETPAQDHARTLLRSLCDRRWHLSSDMARDLNRADTAVPLIKTNIAEIRTYTKDHVKTFDRQISLLIDEHFAALRDRFSGIKGVGPVCIASLIAYLPELGYATREEITALAGLAPYVRDSGIYKGKRRIFGGRKAVRKALYISAMNASRFDEKMSVFYAKLRKKGKPAKVAHVAVARRILVRLNTLASIPSIPSGNLGG